jgi:hypothetical protein
MAMTLAQADLLTVPDLVAGVIETIIEENAELFSRLPFEFFSGENLTFLRENTIPTADWVGIGDTITEASPTHTEITLTPKMLVKDSNLNKFIMSSKSDKMSIEAEYIRSLAKAVSRAFYDRFFYGNSTTNAKEINGLQALVSTASPDMRAEGGGNAGSSAALSLAVLDLAIDRVKPGRPDAIFMNRNIRRRLSQSVRSTSVGGYLTQVVDQYGRFISIYNELPVLVSDFITQVELSSSGAFSAKTGGVDTSVFVCKWGQPSPPEGGIFGIQSSQMAEIERMSMLETKDEIKIRVKWYVGLGLASLYSLSVINGITDVAVVA